MSFKKFYWINLLMFTAMKNDVLIVIRSVGERTVAKCQSLIIDQGVSPEDIEVICESPFSKALLTSYEVGIKRGKKWTLCVDGDLLLKSKAIEKMVSIIESTNDRVFEVQGFIVDKLFGGPRAGGIHLYRTALLPIAKDKLSNISNAIRPEANTLREMEKAGYPFLVVPYIVGVHDFEQSYKDIYRKSFVYGRKHKAYYQMFIERWSRLSRKDDDYLVALEGLERGYHFEGEIISSNVTPETDFEFPKDKEGEVLMTQVEIDILSEGNQYDGDFAKNFPVPFINIKLESDFKTRVHQVLQVFKQLGILRGSFMLSKLFCMKLFG